MKHFLTMYGLEMTYKNPEINDSNAESINTIIHKYLATKKTLSPYVEKNKKLSQSKENKIDELQKYLTLEEFFSDNTTSPKEFDGFFKCGDYGFEADLFDTALGEVKAEQTKEDALLFPFYFCFHCNNKKHAVVILQKVGGNGIKTAFFDDFLTYCQKYHEDYDFKMPLMIQNSVAKAFFDKGNMTNVSVIIDTCPPEIADVIGDEKEKERYKNKFKAEIKLTADSFVKNWTNSAQKNLSKKGSLKIYGHEVKEVKAKVNFGGRTRVFRLDDILNTGIDLEIESKMIDTETGHPIYKLIKKEATTLIKNILN